MESVLQDLRFALRQITRSPGFSALAVLCLAAGIGVNAAAFSALDVLVIGDLPGVHRMRDMRTVLLSFETPYGRHSPGSISRLDWEAFKDNVPAFSHAGVTGFSSVALDVGGQPRAVRADFVSGGLFGVYGTRPAVGRLLSDADDVPGAPPVAVLGHGLWAREYGSDSGVVGRQVQVAGVAFTIVGVAPTGFTGIYPGELGADPEFGAPYLFIPLAAAPLVRAASRAALPAEALDDRWLYLAGRLERGASVRQLEDQSNAVARGLAAQYPVERQEAAAWIRLANTASSFEAAAIVGFVMALPVLIMLVVCANLANQLLARAIQRSGEIAVRLSLGASRARLVRQLLVESSLLALAAAVLGLGVAKLITTIVATQILVMPFGIPVSGRVFGFSVALSLLTALAFGLVPALRATGLDLSRVINEGGRGGGYRRSRLRSGLVVVQVAASVTLLALAGVFARATQRVRVGDPAGNAERVLTVPLKLDLVGYDSLRGAAFQQLAIQSLSELPGVEAVGLATFSPASEPPDRRVKVVGNERGTWVGVAEVRGNWLGAMGMPALRGRVFTAQEMRGGAGVAVIDQVAADWLLPGREAVGATLRLGDDTSGYTVAVIGVVPTLPDPRGESDDGVVIVPTNTGYEARARFYVRTAGAATGMRDQVREAMQSLDRRLPVPAPATLGESLDEGGAAVTQFALAVTTLGTIAVLLAALGLYGVLSFLVEQRRYEIGVRVALGARASSVTGLVLRQSLVLAAIGIVIGALLASATSSFMSGMLFGLPPLDPVAFAGSAALMLVVVLVASAVPAQRAARVDPMVALRSN